MGFQEYKEGVFMKSLKTKLSSIIIVLIAISTIVSIVTVMVKSIQVTNDIRDLLIEDKIAGSNKMLASYLEEQFGKLRLNPALGLVDENGNSIEGQFEYIDQLSNDLGVVVTIFKKDGNGCTRVITNVRDDKGETTGRYPIGF